MRTLVIQGTASQKSKVFTAIKALGLVALVWGVLYPALLWGIESMLAA